MKTIKRFALAFGVSALAGGALLSIATPGSASAVPISSTSTTADCSQSFLTFPTWFRGLVKVQKNSAGVWECAIISPDDPSLGGSSTGLSNFIWHIVLNVIDIGLQAVGYIAAGLIIYGGFKFLTSAGDPQEIAKARKTLLNAVIGLGISIASVAVINLISSAL